eukprot:4080657-Pleurochrysis_carterae.AAC.1
MADVGAAAIASGAPEPIRCSRYGAAASIGSRHDAGTRAWMGALEGHRQPGVGLRADGRSVGACVQKANALTWRRAFVHAHAPRQADV